MNNFAQLIFPFDGKMLKLASPYVVQLMAAIRQIAQEEVHYRKVCAQLWPIKYVVDVGACIGGLSISYSAIWEDAEILAIEPSKYNYPFLQFNTKSFPNIKTLKLAASNKKGSLRIAGPSILQRKRSDLHVNTGLISVHGITEQWAERVDSDTLDNIVKKKVDWLKIDVEGHEFQVLDGAERIISEDRPVLQVEMREDNQAMGEYSISDVVSLIGNHKYAVVEKVTADLIFVPLEKM